LNTQSGFHIGCASVMLKRLCDLNQLKNRDKKLLFIF
jgi:hypothetical protein